MNLQITHGPIGKGSRVSARRAAKLQRRFDSRLRIRTPTFVLLLTLLLPPNHFVSAFFSHPREPHTTSPTELSHHALIANSTGGKHQHSRHRHPRPKRGHVLSNPVSAADCYQAYKDVQQEYYSKAFNPDNQWRILNQRDGVQVALLHHPDDPTCPYVRMSGEFPVSVQECWNFLRIPEWDRTMPKMDPFYEGSTMHGEFWHDKVNMILVRKRTRRILAFGKRDFAFLSVSDVPLKDGTWVSGSLSVETNRMPRVKGYTRAFQDSIAFYEPRNDNTACHITIICRLDLNDSSEEGEGGFIPMWLYVKTIGLTGHQSVIRMREALIEERKERQAYEEEEKEREKMGGWWKPRKLADLGKKEVTLSSWWKSQKQTDEEAPEKDEPAPTRRRFPWRRCS